MSDAAIYHQLRLFSGSAHEKKSLYVRALSVLSPSLLTSENSDEITVVRRPRHSQIKL